MNTVGVLRSSQHVQQCSDSVMTNDLEPVELGDEPVLLFTVGAAKGYARADCLAVYCDALAVGPVSLAAISERAELYGYATLDELDTEALFFIPAG